MSEKQAAKQAKRFRVTPGVQVSLSEWPTFIEPVYRSAKDYERILRDHIHTMARLQDRFYAEDRHALLLIFQGMDAAGKDSAIKHVMAGLNPEGVQVSSFRAPGAEELHHDFLWRAVRRLPARGEIGIFNRSYYEDVLAVRVHPELLDSALPGALVSKSLWEDRYSSIRNLEEHLHRNNTHLVKFYLHLSKQEQRKRFLKRLRDAEKNWKLEMSDVEDRKYWKDYIQAYEDCIRATSTEAGPWYIIPADDKDNARLLISAVVRDILRELKPEYPKAKPSKTKASKQAESSPKVRPGVSPAAGASRAETERASELRAIGKRLKSDS